MFRYLIGIVFALLIYTNVFSQISLGDKSNIDYSQPKEYEIGGITVTGINYLDDRALISLTGLAVGDKIQIPGEEITSAIEKLWKQGLFSDIQIRQTKIVGETIFLDIYLQERPRLSKFALTGMKKSEADDLRDMLGLRRGDQVTDNIINNSRNKIRNFFVDKGFYNVEIDIQQKNDTNLLNNIILFFTIKKHEKVKINRISFEGNEVIEEESKILGIKIKPRKLMRDRKLKRFLKDTKEKNITHVFKTSKYIKSNFVADKKNIIAKYNSKGYRDAQITFDTIYDFNEKLLNIDIKIKEGEKYYFGDITWVGNSKYKSDLLSNGLGIKKGDVYDQELLDDRLFVAENSVSSIYLDNGYLFFSLTPVEISVDNDTINIEMRIYEGKPARIKNVTIIGNSKTHEHVIRREIKTKPGQLFSRKDIIRTQRELAQLGYFNPEKLNVNPKPNQVDGTVDLEYIVEEKPSDQIELSGGWGAQMIVGTLGLSFNNFSLRNMFKKQAWAPLPSGDGQKLRLRAQTNGIWYQSYSMSFTEPWLGGNKPNSLTISLYHNKYTEYSNHDNYLGISGVAAGIGRRLLWPDDWFTLYNELSYKYYDIHDYGSGLFAFNKGFANNISFKTVFQRNSVDQPIYPRRGSSFSLSLQLTPPYSLIEKSLGVEKDYTTMEPNYKYKFIEYHKWKFDASWYQRIIGDLVLTVRGEFGVLGIYNKDIGPSPFEGFTVGGDGLMSYNISGTETVPLRGYSNQSLTQNGAANAFSKYTLELRFPLSLDPNATLYALTFLEGGNAWYKFDEINPFNINRAAGVGVRIFLPMFGKLGVDWGYGFDNLPGDPGGTNSGSQFHFIIGQNF